MMWLILASGRATTAISKEETTVSNQTRPELPSTNKCGRVEQDWRSGVERIKCRYEARR